jgi:hypothetical protein
MAAEHLGANVPLDALLRAAAVAIAAAELAAQGLAPAAVPPPAGELEHGEPVDDDIAIPDGNVAGLVEEQHAPPGPPLVLGNAQHGAAPDGALEDEELGEVDEGPVEAAQAAVPVVEAALDDGEDATTVLQYTESESEEVPVPDDDEVASVEFVSETIVVRADEEVDELGEMPE